MRPLVRPTGSNNFDAIRLAMALLVVWSHSFALGLPTGEKTEPISILTNGHYNAGNIAVMVFFAISGFLIAQSYLKSSNARSFLIKRVRRIYPGYLVATAIGAFVIIPLFATAYDFSSKQIAKTIGLNLLLQNYTPPSTVFARNYIDGVNGSLWSIPHEFWCYLLLATLGISGLLTKARVVFLIAVVSLFARGAFDILERKPYFGIVGVVFGSPYLWSMILPCFLAGTLTLLWSDRLPRSRTLLIIITAMFLALCHAPVSGKLQHVGSEAVFPIVIAYATFYFAFSGRIVVDAARFGDFSYGTYLFAFPIQQMLVSTFALPFFALVTLSVLLSLLAGILSWHLVEKRFLHRRIKPADSHDSTMQVTAY